MLSDRYVEIEDEVLRLTNLNKILYPSCRFTKGDVLNYYRKIAPILLPHLKNRAVTLKRFPSGIYGESFYQKHCPSHRPGWMKTGRFHEVSYCLINDVRTLIWVANLASIELHTVLARIQNPNFPSVIAFDLDPGPEIGFQECAQTALILRELLEKWKLVSFPKTSGGKGLHLYVPLNGTSPFPRCTAFARHCAELLSRTLPSEVTAVMSKKQRQGKIFIDWSQNVPSKSTICAYSLRAVEGPTLSTPITWNEVFAASKKSTAATELLGLSPADIFRRVDRHGDLFQHVLNLRQELPGI